MANLGSVRDSAMKINEESANELENHQKKPSPQKKEKIEKKISRPKFSEEKEALLRNLK